MASGLMIWKGLGLLTNTESPIVVVLRYLLCANFPHITDVSFNEPSRTLSVDRWSPHSTVETCSSSQIPLNNDTTSVISLCTRFPERIYQSYIGCWRLTTLYRKSQSELATFVSSAQAVDLLLLNRRSTEAAVPNPEDQLLLTKGDNNPVDDIALYRGLKHLGRKHVVGKVRGYVSMPAVRSWVHRLVKTVQFLAIRGLRYHRNGEFQSALAFLSWRQPTTRRTISPS